MVCDPHRLARLRGTALLDSPSESAFDRLTRLASAMLHAPVALVSLVDENRQFFKSSIGLPESLASKRETPLSYSFCQHVVASAEPLIIEDAREHPVVRDNPAVHEFNVVAYAGIPLTTLDGFVLGSFCVFDTVPRLWTDPEIALLTDIAASVMTEVELRAAATTAEELALQLQDQTTELEQQVEEAQALTEELELTNDELQDANTELEERARAAAAAAERTARLLALSTGLNEAIGVEQVADVVFREAMAAVSADAGSLALVIDSEGDEHEMEIVRTNGFAGDLVERFHRFPVTSGRPLSDAVRTRRPVLVDSREASQVRYPEFMDIGYEGFAAVPVVHAGRARAVILFSFTAPQQFDGSTEIFLRTIGEQCAQALERARLYDLQSRQGERTAFLAEVSRLLASSLDYERTLRTVAEASVPELGDWCAVDIVTDPMSSEWPPQLQRLAVVHKDPAMMALGLSFQERFPTDWDAPTGMPSVLRDGTVQFIPSIIDEMLVAGASSAEHLTALRELQFSSLILVPLIARGRTLGALTLVMSDSGRCYDENDLALAQDVAGRAAIAIDNARLFRAAQDARVVAEEAKASAVSANKAKSDFLATMSHEIRTPINAVLGYSELMELELSGPLTEDQRTQLGRIRSSTRHLLGLVNEVLDLAKIESGTLRVESAYAPTGDTVDAALSLIRPQAAAKGITVSEQCEGARSATYIGDEHRVRQVLTNLLSNAVKFTGPDGSISVSCAVTNDIPRGVGLVHGRPYIAFRVVDTGIGIPAEQLARIFQPFEQGGSGERSPYTREQSGTGLGLAISRQLAQLMGGEITVVSEPTHGSTFTFWLPTPEHKPSVGA